MRRTALAIMAVFYLTAVSGLAGDEPRFGPPPLRVEAPTLQPGPAYVWLPGYWKWGGVNYIWVEGRWVKAKLGKVWVPGVWEQVGNRWVWKHGTWKKIAASKPMLGKKKKK